MVSHLQTTKSEDIPFATSGGNGDQKLHWRQRFFDANDCMKNECDWKPQTESEGNDCGERTK